MELNKKSQFIRTRLFTVSSTNGNQSSLTDDINNWLERRPDYFIYGIEFSSGRYYVTAIVYYQPMEE